MAPPPYFPKFISRFFLRFFLRKQVLNLLRQDFCIFVLAAVFIAVEAIEQAIAL
jgi:hypothetical protein